MSLSTAKGGRVDTAFLSPTYASSFSCTQQVTCRPIPKPKTSTSAPVASQWRMTDHLPSAVSSHQRIACLCQYNGAEFSGWERKPGTATIQNTIEREISTVCGKSVRTAAASKTDAGTHAIGQVFHFDPPPKFANCRAWTTALNKGLPAGIRILEANQVPLSFHARKSAAWRRYRYTILTSNHNSPFLAPFVWHLYKKPLNVTLMNDAAKTLRCHHPNDFSAFRKARSSAAHSIIALHDISVHRPANDPNLLEIEVCANWFVYGMMRLLTAALVDVGSGALTVEEFYDIFRLRQRYRIRSSAPARGLCLLEVGYSSQQHPFTSSELLRNGTLMTLGLSPYHSSTTVG